MTESQNNSGPLQVIYSNPFSNEDELDQAAWELPIWVLKTSKDGDAI